MRWPSMSVVTPSYNQARFIEASLRSVLDQHYPRLEYIVIDGGSTDGSVEVIRRHAGRLAYWVSEPDNGQTDALIKGFARATGDILCWLNSDDLLEPGSLGEVAQFFESNPRARVVYGDATCIDVRGGPLKRKQEHAFSRFVWMYDHNYIPQPSTFWRRDLYEEVGGLDPQFDLAMDADLWIRFAQVTPMYHVNRVWSCERIYPEQKNQRLRARSDAEDLLIRRRYLGDERPWSRRAKALVAKGMRVTWKLALGSYRSPQSGSRGHAHR